MKRALLALVVLASGCSGYLQRVNSQVLAEYHASRMQAVALAALEDKGRYSAPEWPPVPLICGKRVEGAYAALVPRAEEVRRAWTALLHQSEGQAAFISKFITALTGRNVEDIRQYSTLIARQDQNFAAARLRWEKARAAQGQAVAALRQAWDEAWPGNSLRFSLAQSQAELEAGMAPRLDGQRLQALHGYHHDVYTRLAMTYLGYTPPVLPNPLPPVPTGCERLADALKRLETSLGARYDLDAAIQLDISRVEELGHVDLDRMNWDQIERKYAGDGGRYLAASVARLKLYKLLDSMLTSALDVQVREVELKWSEVWPEPDVVLNLFSFAGVSLSALDDTSDGLNRFTFRR